MLKLRIENNTRFPMTTKVILIMGEDEIDLTKEGIVQWPIQMEINDKGMFAILKLPLETVIINDN